MIREAYILYMIVMFDDNVSSRVNCVSFLKQNGCIVYIVKLTHNFEIDCNDKNLFFNILCVDLQMNICHSGYVVWDDVNRTMTICKAILPFC